MHTAEEPRDDRRDKELNPNSEETELKTVLSDEARRLIDKNRLQSSVLSNFKEFDPQQQKLPDDESRQLTDFEKQIQKQMDQLAPPAGPNKDQVS